ncbi:MAG: lytic transglycosylase domain-containing protein, partial [Erysipelotrichia bacterium]|nr:lytic transglycosylase domain-containing protein [Erysipelotrichia bacterium]
MKKHIFKLSAILLFGFSNANGTTTEFLQKDFKVTLEWLEQKPKSYAKDFFILQYLNQENLPFEKAKIAYEMGNGTNATLKKVFNEKYNKKAPVDLKCYRATIEQLKSEDSKCIALGLSLQEATQISKSDLEYFISRLDPYPTLKNDLKIIASNDPFSSLIKSDMNRFFRLFFDLGEPYRVKFFNKSFSA